MEATMGNGAGRMQSAARDAERSANGFSREFHDFVADIEELVRSSASLSADDLERFKGELSARVDAAKETLGESGRSMVIRARRAAAATNDYVYDEPWKAVGLGIGLGFMIGVLTARR